MSGDEESAGGDGADQCQTDGPVTLGLDRDSEIVAHLFDERNPAVMRLVHDVIRRAHACGRKVGICGQAPSDYPEFARFLVTCGIDSISLNPDTVLKTTQDIVALEGQRAEQREADRSWANVHETTDATR